MTTTSRKQTGSIPAGLYLAIFLAGTGLIVTLGMALAFLIPATWVATLAGLSIFVLIALLVTHFFKGLSIFQLPLLILVCLLSGLMLSQLTNNSWYLAFTTVALFVNFLLLLIGAKWLPFQFRRFNLLLALLAIGFSFVGGMLIFIEGSTTVQLIWLSAAILVLDLLLYTLTQQILQIQDQPVRPMFIGVVLLHIALAMNLLLLMPIILS